MGKKTRSKQSVKVQEKDVRNKKELLVMAANLVQMCMATHKRQDEWEFFINLHKAVELFQKKQKQGPLVPDKAERSDALPSFLKWLRENGASFSKIELQKISDEQGYGFVAAEEIQDNTLLTKVPDSVMLKFTDAQNSYLGPLIKCHDVLAMMPNVSLALFLHCERHNVDSFFKPYLDMLPSDFNTTLYFNPSELQYLKGSATLGAAVNQYKAIVRQFGIIYQLLNSKNDKLSEILSHVPQAAIDSFDFDAYRWGVSVVTTRQNKIPHECDGAASGHGCGDSHASNWALIPLWDMFNHDVGEMTTQYNDETKSVESFAMRSFEAGEEVTICYGNRPNYELFVHNGFIFTDNPFDRMKIPLGISTRDALYEKKSNLLKRLSLEASSYFTITPMSNDSSVYATPLVAFLRVFHMNEGELDVWLDTETVELGALQQITLSENQATFESESVMWKFLENRLGLLIMGTQRTIESSNLNRTLSARAKLSVSVRVEELKVLRSCQAFCTGKALEEAVKQVALNERCVDECCDEKIANAPDDSSDVVVAADVTAGVAAAATDIVSDVAADVTAATAAAAGVAAAKEKETEQENANEV